MRDSNPFEREDIAEQWIKSVENEKGLLRDTETYPRLVRWFNGTSKGSVLDIGSGQGIASTKIQGYKRYVGVEPSSVLVDRAKALYQENDIKKFVQGDVYELPFPDQSFDQCFSINVWFHLEDIIKASQEMARVLKIGGQFWIHTANGNEVNIWKKFYINPTIDDKKMVGELKIPINNLSVNTFYFHKNRDIVESLERFGLRVTNVAGVRLKGKRNDAFMIVEGVRVR